MSIVVTVLDVSQGKTGKKKKEKKKEKHTQSEPKNKFTC